jgi:hypothetical protein
MRLRLTTGALVIALGFIAYDRIANHSHAATAQGKTVTVRPTLLTSQHNSVPVDGPILGFSCVQTTRPPQMPECYVLVGE